MVYLQYINGGENMGEQLLTLYNSLTLEAKKQLYDFAFYLASKTSNVKTKEKVSDGSDFFGALHKYASPELISKEKNAWLDAAADKHRSSNDN